MPRVSRKLLSEKYQERLWGTLLKAFSSLRDQKALAELLHDLLTPTERLMLSKRLAAAMLLEKGYSFVNIAEALHLSTATIGVVKQALRRSGKGYRKVLHILYLHEREELSRKQRAQDRAERIDAFLRSLLPPMKGSRSSFRSWQRNLKRFSRP